MSILALIKKYISLRIDQLEIDNRRDENLNKFITSLTDFILSDKINRLLDVCDIAWLKGISDKEKGFKPTESDIEKIGKEIAYNMEHRPIPYLMEMLNIEIRNTMEEAYDEKIGYIDNKGCYREVRHLIEYHPDVQKLPYPVIITIVNLLTCNNKEEILQYTEELFSNPKNTPLLLNLWKKLETKSSNIIMGRLLTLIQNERMQATNSSK